MAVKGLSTLLFIFSLTCSLLVENENNIITRVNLIQPDDLLICMSLEGKTIAVIAAAKEAKNNGANIIGVTSKYNSNLSKYTDIIHTVVSSTLYEKMKFLFLLYCH
ncbi:MAG: SIS domain-containing protein [Spiroplasma phoeniceum]|nr:MAG: SIS domain-containing protein [Spiroplasma phoeniceum]UZQ33638.1 MAG: SIS domain-containing protein [Spiroplasma phoeniceum]